MIYQNPGETGSVDAEVRSEGNLAYANFARVNLNPFLHRVLS